MSIPRRIIQTAKTRELSTFSKACAANLKLLHPDWEYLFFDDAAAAKFVADEFPQYVPIFKSFPKPIQRVDFFRYLAVHRLGGFYFDFDVILAENLTPLTAHSCVFPFESLTLSSHLRQAHGMDWEIGNYAFGSAPGQPFLQAVIDNCVKAQQDSDWLKPMMADIPGFLAPDFRVLNSTGPGLISRTLAERRPSDITVLFPGDVCDRKNWFGFGTYGVHLMEGSWRSNDSLARRISERWWKSWRRRRQLPQSLALGPNRKP